MHYSRRNFLKAAGAGIALTAVEGESLFAAIAPPLPAPITKERGTFIINGQGRKSMKKVSVYRPTTIEEAQQILSIHGSDAAVYAGGTDLLIHLKNRLKQAPTYLVDIKKINNLRYIKEDAQGGVQIGALTNLALAVQAPSNALGNAAPLKYNATKIDMAKGLLASGLTKLASF